MIDPPLHHDILNVVGRINLCIRFYKCLICIIICMLQKTYKLVCIQSAAETFTIHKFPVKHSHVPQKLIPRRNAKNIVDQLKVLYIRTDNIIV